MLNKNILDYPAGITPDNVMNQKEHNAIQFDRKKLPVDLKPLEVTLNLLTFTKGANNTIITIKLTIKQKNF